MPRDRHQVFYVAFMLLGMYALLAARLVIIQVSSADEHEDRMARATRRSPYKQGRATFERGSRGSILDANGQALAMGYDTYRLYHYTPSARSGPNNAVERRLERANDLLRILEDREIEFDADELLADIAKASGARFLIDGLDENDRRYISETLRLDVYNDFYFESDQVREYPYGRLAAQVVGFVGRHEDDVDDSARGRAGVELMLEQVLAGRDGRFDCSKDAVQREFDLDGRWIEAPRDGMDVHLTLDMRIQAVADEALGAVVQTIQCDTAVVCVLETRTGRVLAMTSRPDFDPKSLGTNDFRLADTRCRAIADSYPPGSVMKPFIAAHALEARMATLETEFDVGGGLFTFEDGRARRLVHDSSRHGVDRMTMRRGLAKSSNIYMCQLAIQNMGQKGIYDAIERFRFRKKSGIVLGPDSNGSWTDREKGTLLYSALSMSFGREMRISPLSLAANFSVFGTGGIYHPPILIDSIGSGDDRVVQSRESERLCSSETMASVKGVLIEAVEDGTGRVLKGMKWTVAAKTGTAKILGHPQLDGAYCSSMAALAPASNPEITVLCVLYGVRGATYYGGQTAGPVVREIIERTLAMRGTVSDRPLVAGDGR